MDMTPGDSDSATISSTTVNASYRYVELGMDGIGESPIRKGEALAQNIELSLMEKVLFVYGVPFLIVIGVFGNAFTCYMFRKSPLNKYSVSVYMCAYNVSNILILTLNFGIMWIDMIRHEVHFMHGSEPACRLWSFVINMVTYSGVWFIVAMMIDRYISLWHSSKASDMCTVFVAKLSVCVILVGLTVLSIHAMWTYGLNRFGQCTIPHHAGDPHSFVWYWVSPVLYVYLPLLLLCIIGGLAGCAVPCRAKSRDPVNGQLTCTSLTLACVYFALNTPATAINVIDSVAPRNWKNDTEIESILGVTRNIAQFFIFVNLALTLGVCVCCSAEFRRQIRSSLCSRCVTSREGDLDDEAAEKCTSL